MTGYGRNEAMSGGKKILCEIKSVNHRYSDYTIKVPRYYGFLEDKVRAFISEYISRGKVDVYVAVESFADSDKEIVLNTELAKSYVEALKSIRCTFGLTDEIKSIDIARFPDVIVQERKDEDEEEVWSAVKDVLAPAAAAFVAMREREGERIQKDIENRIEYMKTLVSKIEQRSPQTVCEYQDRLYAKIKDLLRDKEIDDARVLTEVAIFADKVAVNEETVRLASHFEEFYRIIGINEPAGRKLDFLIQEINREINTTGSKANDIEIAKLVVDLKAETEKLREQIQNIE